jgi:predicted DNA-binding transcriptional regulator AlpA
MKSKGYLSASATDAAPQDRLLRLRQVLELIPLSRSGWWAGVRAGRFPAAVKLGPRAVAWRASDIQRLIDELGA